MRNRYLDLLRAAAVVRVVLYHVTGLPVLTIVFPAMSVMFALGGAMMAASLDRSGPAAVERRLHRLLPSLWVLSAIAVPSMMVGGQTWAGLGWDAKLLFWFFPLQDPPAAGLWTEALSATWYLRDFLWFVLLSPLLLPIFRRVPLLTLAAPYVALTVITLAGLTPHPIVRDLALYGGPWLLGFAYQDGLLKDRRWWWVVGASAAGAVAWVLTHPGPRGYDLNDIPLGNALWSLAAILVLLRFTPSAVRENRLVSILNARALTIYLWHVPIIVLITHAGEDAGWPIRGPVGVGWRLVVVGALITLVVMAVGWVEDLAGNRSPALVPGNVRPTRQDGGHDVHPRAGTPYVLRARIRQHPRRVPHLGRQHDLPAGRGAHELPGVRR